MGYNAQFLTSHSLGSSFVSQALQVVDASVYAIQLNFSGSPCSFSAKLQISSDAYNNTVAYVPLHWDDLADSSQAFVSAGTFTYQVGGGYVGHNWVRLSITDNSSGSNTGVLNAVVNVKD